MARGFSTAFLAREAAALQLLPDAFRDPPARRAIAEESARRRISPELAAVLRAQDRALPASRARAENIEALARAGSVAVVSGQQVGLFLGPLYTLYKAASAIALARSLEADSGVRAIPVFWLQTEDHDFGEIDHCFVRSRAGPPLRVSLAGASSSADSGDTAAFAGADSAGSADSAGGTDRCSVAHRRLGSGVGPALGQLAEAIGELPHATEVIDLFARHYRAERSIAAAFTGVIAELFGEEGLVIFDPRDPGVGALGRPTHQQAILRFREIAAALEERGRALKAAGFGEQVCLRQDSPLVFFHPQGAEGPRHRLEQRAAAWAVLGTEHTLSEAELLRALDDDPLRFSTSALLRPILEDRLFPTAAYVGGPGEINYFAQVMPLYPLFDLSPPMIVPRARFRLIEPKTYSLLQKLELEPKDAERPRDELLGRLLGRSESPFPRAEEIQERLSSGVGAELARLQDLVPALDPTLGDPLHKTKETIAGAIHRFTEKYGRALRERDRVTAERVERLQQDLLPNGVPQERAYGLAHFAARTGIRELKARIFSALDPWAAEIGDLEL